ncbi:hypothetical protein CROQUDRAFT_60947 [Cronartium quercuum f. sp. fusiforme G11]|uniref:Uncharacterized protein n=1 Tax=Cronartium quercuum f. sp. fusiforme G11 TaxID=708437 RepID=A0A9P6NLE2_9BASI|nr:hypothetical protein CROQUDRAFT_60947 [Cronartium quercuum f. sp. fusiforme G11]
MLNLSILNNDPPLKPDPVPVMMNQQSKSKLESFKLDTRARQLNLIIEKHDLQIQSLKNSLSDILPRFPPLQSDFMPQHPQLQPSNTSTITPKPRPTLPSRVLVGYPLREPSPNHDPAVPKAIAPVGLNPTMEEIISWPQRGAQAHRVSFLLNPTMNPAKENIRDLTPPLPGCASTSASSPSTELESTHPSGPARSDWYTLQNPSLKRGPEERPPDIPRKRYTDHHRSSSSSSNSNSNLFAPFTDSYDRREHESSEHNSGFNSHHHGPDSTAGPRPPILTRRTVSIPGSDFRPYLGSTKSPLPPLTLRSKNALDLDAEDLKSNDLIGSGRISYADAQIYWDIFFRQHANRLTWSHRDQHDIDSVRSASDLLLASILSVSAKALGHHVISDLCIDEVKTLTRCTMFPVRNHNVQDLKGIIAIAVYHGIHSVCAHFVTLCLTLKLHKVFVKLTDPNLRGTAAEEELVEKGRTWLMVVIYSHVFCVFSKKMYLICSPRKVITDHAKILLSSKCAKKGDRLIQAHVELVSVLATAQDKLDSRRYPGPLNKRREQYVVPEIFGVLQDLEDWSRHWQVEAPELFATDNDGPGGFAKRLRNPQQYVYLFIMHAAVWPCQDGQIIMADEWRYHWAVQGCKCAEGILSAALSAREERASAPSDPPPAFGPDLPVQVEYEKVTLGLATGYLLWICQVIPGHIQLARYRALIGRLHAIDFKESCEYTDLIEAVMGRIDSLLLEIGKEKTSTIEDSMAEDLDRLITDTRFWFMIDIDREFKSPPPKKNSEAST